MSGPEDNPADDDPHHECGHEIDRLALRVEQLESQLADAARLLKDASPPLVEGALDEILRVREWCEARKTFVEYVTGEKS